MDLMKPVLTIIFTFFIVTVFAQAEKGLIVKGNELYKKQAYEEAANEYKKAAEKNQKSAEAQFNLGNAYHKTKKPFDAMEAYKSAYENSLDKNIKSQAAYNQGVLMTRQQKLPESIELYKGALKLNPEDVQARENLQRAINELKKQQQQQKDQQKNKDKQSQDKNKDEDDQDDNKSNLSKKRAEQMLDALRQQEKKIQQNLQNKNKTGKIQMKDW
jgi:Ca-activated chloride channel family protein